MANVGKLHYLSWRQIVSIFRCSRMHQDMVFIKADCHGMVVIFKSLNITVFPTFVIFALLSVGKELSVTDELSND